MNNYGREELAKYVLGGVSPMPHPKEFTEAIDYFHRESPDDLYRMIQYCTYLGECKAKDRKADVDFERYYYTEDTEKVWIDFLEDEGVFLEFSIDYRPKGKGNEKGKPIRYEDILSYAFGEVGLNPSVFYAMTMKEYECYCNGYMARRWRPDEYVRKMEHLFRQIFRGKGSHVPSTPEGLYELPTDKAKSITHTEDQIREMWRVANSAEK